MRLGIIARADKTGLANQTKNLCEMLKPDKVLVINSKPFNGKDQVKGIYDKYNAYGVQGFPHPQQCQQFLKGLDAILTCETFYGNSFIAYAKMMKVKTFNQFNFEFLDYLLYPQMPMVDILISPSYWMLDEVKEKYDNTVYCPPPTDERIFLKAREKNLSEHKKRFLHIVGNPAVNDRNGTNDLLASLLYTDSDFELHIKSQIAINLPNDHRIIKHFEAVDDEAELYSGFDALIMPRKYGGLCLPMNEALMSGLPVIMTNTSPNNKILPAKWLVHTEDAGSFFTRTTINMRKAEHKALAQKLDWLCEVDLSVEKANAVEIAMENFSFMALHDKWVEILNGV